MPSTKNIRHSPAKLNTHTHTVQYNTMTTLFNREYLLSRNRYYFNGDHFLSNLCQFSIQYKRDNFFATTLYCLQMMMMATTVILVALAAVCVAEVAQPKTYTTKYDNIDLDEIIHNDRLLKNYVDCLLDKGRCTPDGLELKSK